MKTTVYKYTLALNHGPAPVSIPDGAEILYVNRQGQAICLWARVDPTRPMTVRRFGVFGTGHDLPMTSDSLSHVGSFLDGPLVWHVFEYA